jgi:hypothetical protein
MHVLEYVLFCTGFLVFTLSFRLVLWSNNTKQKYKRNVGPMFHELK